MMGMNTNITKGRMMAVILGMAATMLTGCTTGPGTTTIDPPAPPGGLPNPPPVTLPTPGTR